MRVEKIAGFELHNADCLHVMQGMEPGSVDAIVTDPPYFRVKGEDWDNQWDDANHFIEWVGQLCEQFQRILKPNGSLYFFASPQMAARVECEIGKRFNVLNSIVWRKTFCKTYATEKEALRMFAPITERVIFAEKIGATHCGLEAFNSIHVYFSAEKEKCKISYTEINEKCFGTASNGGGMASNILTTDKIGWSFPTREKYEALQKIGICKRPYEDLRCEYEELRREYEELRRPFNVTAKQQWGDVWDFEPVMGYAGKHPCEKPQALLRHILYASTKAGAVVFDPFMGGGSLGHACHETGRGFIGVEKCPQNFEIARMRIEQAAAQAVMFGGA